MSITLRAQKKKMGEIVQHLSDQCYEGSWLYPMTAEAGDALHATINKDRA